MAIACTDSLEDLVREFESGEGDVMDNLMTLLDNYTDGDTSTVTRTRCSSAILNKDELLSSIRNAYPHDDGGSSTSEGEMDKFLERTWSRCTDGRVIKTLRGRSSPSPYVKVVTKLKEYYDQKQGELERPISTLQERVESTQLDQDTKQEITETIATTYRHNMQIQLKRCIIKTIERLRKKHLPADFPKARLQPNIIRILKEYYINFPYPTRKQKEKLARDCGITLQQVTTWFNNHRRRYKSKPGIMKGRGSRKGKGRISKDEGVSFSVELTSSTETVR